MTKEDYEIMCADIEGAKMYDGRGTYDLYECELKNDPKRYPGIPQSVIDSMPKGCGHQIITTYADKGVTPFTIKCPKCGARMTHTKTFVAVPNSVPVLKWVRPTFEQYKNMSREMKEHIENGGLVLENTL